MVSGGQMKTEQRRRMNMNENINDLSTEASDEFLEEIVGGDCKNTCVCTRQCSVTKIIAADGSETEDGGDY
jgi:hypothetical protein